MKNLSKLRLLSFLLALAPLLSLFTAPARAEEIPRRLADLHPKPTDPEFVLGTNGEPTGFFQLGGRLLFSTFDENSLDEGILWSTDGTAAGTVQASSSLCPARCVQITVLAVWRGLAFLRTVPEIQPAQLWRTDGTPGGTFPLRGPAGEALGSYEVVGDPESDAVYFVPYTVANEVWRSDGTAAGTRPVRAADGSAFEYPRGLTFWKGRLYFVARHYPASGDPRTGLWSTDGTAAGTLFLTPVEEADAPPRLVATPSHLFFTAGPDGKDLWATDGTPAGTRGLADLPYPPCPPPVFECFSPDVDSVEAFGDAVYFKVLNRGDRAEIWRSDGTEAGTRPLIGLPEDQVQNLGELHRLAGRWIFPIAPQGHINSDPSVLWTADDGFAHAAPLTGCAGGACPALAGPLADLGAGRWLFAGRDPVHGVEPWITDGTGPGTRLLADVCPGDCDGVVPYDTPPPLAAPGTSGEIYFRAYTPAESDLPSDELWRTDGTPEGTRRVAGHVSGIGALGGLVYFGGASPRRAALELWRTDGTAAGTRRVDVLWRYFDGPPPLFLPFRGGARFLAAGGDGVYRLWRSDGTPEGTAPLRGFELDPPREVRSLLGRAGGLAFFDVVRPNPSGEASQEELWRSDGTPEGTRGLLTLGSALGIDPLHAVWGDRLLFLPQESHGCSLWVSDGTAAGTRQLLPPPPGARCPTVLAPLSSSRFLFVARIENPKGPIPQVFVSDGTVAGTRQITALHGTRDPVDDQGLQIGGTVFFRIGSLTAGAELWRSDGTPEGTRRVAPLFGVSPLHVFRGDLYFIASSPDTGDSGLYRLSAPGGLQLLAAVQPPPDAGDQLPPFASAGDRLFFVGQDPEHGAELWVTDGTPEGTHLARDLQPGAGSSTPAALVSAGDRIFFSADDGIHGRELWESDGTPEGTRLVADLAPGGFSSLLLYDQETFPAVSNGYLFFAADDGNTGLEPWALPLAP
jgi:ELWxxDGT repeat protein